MPADFERRRVGSTALSVPVLGFGSAHLGELYNTVTEADSVATVDAAWDAGIRYFDTAPHYGLGLAECRLGKALAGRERGDFSISSKVGRLIVGKGKSRHRVWDFSASGVRRSISESLDRLGLDRLDIALVHDPEGHLDLAIHEAAPELERMRAEGLVGAIGVGSGNVGALVEFATHTTIDAVMVAGRYTLLEQPARPDLVPICVKRGISILNAGIFNSGLLASDYPASSATYEYSQAPAELITRARGLADLAHDYDTSLPAAALQYAAQLPAVVTVVVGAETPEQVRQNRENLVPRQDLSGLWSQI